TIFAIAPSRKEPDTIWTGSDDGLVQITRDAGKSWTNVTPPGAPDLSRVSIVEASPTKAGTAYVAIKNYLQDDRKPYLFKTDDYGKTWKKIVGGIRDGDYTHAVREDTKRAGLLYAGAEHGIYVSFDDGERWQPLSLNLPDTPVSDIVVEEHDLVIATHGRSMWVLDNIAPLRQLTPDVVRTTALHLFAPEEATRRPRPVAIDYFLKNKADKVQIEILDNQGRLVRAFTGPQEHKPAEGEDDDEENGRGAPPPVGVDAGLNRFVWDMRYPGGATFPGEIMWGAQP